MSFVPSVAKPEDTARAAVALARIDRELSDHDADALDVTGFMAKLRELGQRRSTIYEPMLRRRYSGRYGRGFDVYARLQPDVISSEYVPCAIAGTTGKNAAITRAISRKGHSIEFTSFLDDDLNGLDAYLRGKIEVYARMLESV